MLLLKKFLLINERQNSYILSENFYTLKYSDLLKFSNKAWIKNFYIKV